MNDPLIGNQIHQYRVDALLGRGGMARVYRGWDTRLKRYVALKVVDSPFRTDTDAVNRFHREAQTIANLKHPNIIGIHHFGEADDVLYMAMPFVEGADLGQVLAQYRKNKERIAARDALRIIREVCSALDYAHQQGVIHRDVKPSNILLDKDGRAILSDFGLVLLTETGTRGEIFGSPHYIAPEQAISSAKAVPQSDLYSVGVILYEMFTGRLPFDSEEPIEIALKHLQDDIPAPRLVRPDIPEALEKVILTALAKDPAARYPSGKLLADALQTALKGEKSTPRLSIPQIVEQNKPVLPNSMPRPTLSRWRIAKPKSGSPFFYFLLGALTTLVVILAEIYLFVH